MRDQRSEIRLGRWLARLAAVRCGGVSPNAVSLVPKNQKIEPQMNRMDADGQRENPMFICVLYLRPSEFICG